MLGLVGLLFSFVPLIGVIAWPLVILGLIFGIIGVVRVRNGAATNKGLSIAGIAVSAIGLVVCVLWAVAFGNAADDLDRDLQRIDEQLNQGRQPAPPNGANPPETEAAGHTVVYEVTGSGKALTISYTTDGMATTEQQQDAPPPLPQGAPAARRGVPGLHVDRPELRRRRHHVPDHGGRAGAPGGHEQRPAQRRDVLGQHHELVIGHRGVRGDQHLAGHPLRGAAP